jgi:hypothetical protein
MALMRSAESSPVLTLTSATTRRYWWLPRVRSTWVSSSSLACLLTWLTAPPVEPRPKSIDAEPRSTSMRSMLKVSRS